MVRSVYIQIEIRKEQHDLFEEGEVCGQGEPEELKQGKWCNCTWKLELSRNAVLNAAELTEACCPVVMSTVKSGITDADAGCHG